MIEEMMKNNCFEIEKSVRTPEEHRKNSVEMWEKQESEVHFI